MNFKKKSVRDVSLKGERVVMRVDFNVPVKEGKVKDDTRIRAAVPTIKYIIEHGASLVLLSHLGRPDGERKVEFSPQPTAEVLSKLIGQPVQFADDCVGEAVVSKAMTLKPGEVMVCENTRFHKEEDMKAKTDEDKAKADAFAKELAKLGTIYVNDAFGTAHRSHGSTAKSLLNISKLSLFSGHQLMILLPFLSSGISGLALLSNRNKAISFISSIVFVISASLAENASQQV